VAETIASFVDWWTLGWTVALTIGYLAEFTPWPRLRVFRSPVAAKAMLMTSTAIVLGFTLADNRRAAALIAAWAIVFSSLNWLFHYFKAE